MESEQEAIKYGRRGSKVAAGHTKKNMVVSFFSTRKKRQQQYS